MNKNLYRSFLGIFFLAVLTTWTPRDAETALPTPNQAMLDRLLPKTKIVADDALKQPMTYEHAILTITQLVKLRREALSEINSETPLTSFDGIETQDQYDLEAIQSLLAITHAATDQDSTPSLVEYHQRLAEAIGAFPALGDSPVAFMIYVLAELTIVALDKLWTDPSLSREETAKTAVVLIHAGALIFDASTSETLFRSKASGFRQSSVMARLRCPFDQGTYAISKMKNRIDEEGNITTVYYATCEVGAETIVLDFPQYLASRLNRIAKKQKIKKNRKIPHKNQGVEP